jgi:hypothetical protein
MRDGMSTDWHVDSALLAQYERGALDPSRIMAVEAHLLACPACRSAVPADEAWLDSSWAGVFDDIHAPVAGPVQRLMVRAGLPDHRLRLLTATPVLRWSWLSATATVLALAVAAAWLARSSGADAMSTIFLVLAPVLPVAAVSGAYGPAVDPMFDITGTTPAAGPTLVLWRSVSVIGVAMTMAAVAAVLLPGPAWLAAAWLLPALLLCVGTLALATSMSLPRAAGSLGGTWLAGVLAVQGMTRGHGFVPVLFGPATQLVYLAAVVAAAAILIRRRRHFDLGESR